MHSTGLGISLAKRRLARPEFFDGERLSRDSNDFVPAIVQRLEDRSLLSAMTLAPYVGINSTLHVASNLYAIDLDNATAGNGTGLTSSPNGGGNSQIFRIENAGGDVYRIRHAASGRVLDAVASNVTQNGCRVQLYDDLGGANQRWRLTTLDDGRLSITNAVSGLALDVSTQNGHLQLWTYLGGQNQRWIPGTGATVGNTIRVQNTGLALTAGSANPANGASISLSPAVGLTQQEFRTEPVGDGTVRIRHIPSGKVLDAVASTAGNNGGLVQLWDQTDGLNQRWWLQPLAGGRVRIVNAASGKALDAATTDGHLQIWEGTGAENQSWQVSTRVAASQRPSFDFDGDRKSDKVTYRRGDGIWEIEQSSNGAVRPILWGGVDQSAVAGVDYDGDQRTDLAVYRAVDGYWSLLLSSRDFDRNRGVDVQFGGPGQIPIGGMDLNGDGFTDLATYQTTTGNWSIRETNSNHVYGVAFGGADQVPVPGIDFDGDGKNDLAAYRPADGMWWIRRSSDSFGQGFQWGGGTQQPVGNVDLDGDGRSDLATYQPVDGSWAVLLSSQGFDPGRAQRFYVGGPSRSPVGGFDANGDGRTDVTTYDRTTRTWAVRNAVTGVVSTSVFGGSEAESVVASNPATQPSFPTLSFTQANFTQQAGTTVTRNASAVTLEYGVPAPGRSERGRITFTPRSTKAVTDAVLQPFSLGTLGWRNSLDHPTQGNSDPRGYLSFKIGLGDRQATVNVWFQVDSTADGLNANWNPDRLSILPTTIQFTGPTGRPVTLNVLGLRNSSNGTIGASVYVNETETNNFEFVGQLVPGGPIPQATLYTSGLVSVEGTALKDDIIVGAAGQVVTVKFRNAVGTYSLLPSIGSQPTLTFVKRIDVYGRAEDDILASTTAIPTKLDGGFGNDVLIGGAGNDVLFGGIGDHDTLTGNGGADRFLAELGSDWTTDRQSNDALIYFSSGDKPWDNNEIREVDKGFQLLFDRTANNTLLKLADGKNMEFQRYTVDLSLGPGSTYTLGSNTGTIIRITNLAFVTADSPVWTTVIHEIGHNWDVAPLAAAFVALNGKFADISGWTKNPPLSWRSSLIQGIDINTFTQANENEWWHRPPISRFVSSYARNNPREDFSETLVATFFTNSRYDPSKAPTKVVWMNNWLNTLK